MLKTEINTGEIQLKQLWDRLQEYDPDDDDSAFSFSSRISSENGWSYLETFRVLEEYKRYLFLCIAVGHPVCPSEKVDQVWHLHLVYTHSYWDDLCRNVLQCPLHHNPTKGGESETEKHIQMYEQTLSDYQKFFNEEPPADIWPDAEKRFGEDTHFCRVNLQKYWLVPRISHLFSRLKTAVVIFFALIWGDSKPGISGRYCGIITKKPNVR